MAPKRKRKVVYTEDNKKDVFDNFVRFGDHNFLMQTAFEAHDFMMFKLRRSQPP